MAKLKKEEWREKVFPTAFTDVSKETLHKEQAPFLHGGKWVETELDPSFYHAKSVLESQKLPQITPERKESYAALFKRGMFGGSTPAGRDEFGKTLTTPTNKDKPKGP